jgi:hypothetical protein
MYHAVTQTSDRRPDDKEPEATGGGGEEGRAPERESPRKERVLHTRVPAVLERELKRFADNLRIPVSNLVRAILEDAVSAADAATLGVEARLKRAAEQLEQERKKLKKRVLPDQLDKVFAFQTVLLAQPAACADCGKELARGAVAHLGLTDPPAPGGERIFVCDGCLPRPG